MYEKIYFKIIIKTLKIFIKKHYFVFLKIYIFSIIHIYFIHILKISKFLKKNI